MIKIIDNFLESSYFNKIKEDFFNTETAWYFREKATDYTTSNRGYFTHCLFNHNKPFSPYISNLEVFFKKLNVKALIQVRANLVFSTPKPTDTGWHTDYAKNYGCKTAILFFNDTDSKTIVKFKKKEYIVESKENRICIFKNECEHKLLTHTKPLKRIILNTNFY